MGVRLVTTRKKNMKPVALTAFEKALLKRHSLIETVFDELKNLCQIELGTAPAATSSSWPTSWLIACPTPSPHCP